MIEKEGECAQIKWSGAKPERKTIGKDGTV